MFTCDGCGGEVPNDGIGNHEYGLSTPISHLGHYSGFTDSFGWLEDETEEWFVMCHDCVLRLLETFPGLAAKMRKHRGHHPNMNGERNPQKGTDTAPCCEHAWTWDVSEDEDGNTTRTTFVANQNGEWEKIAD